MKSGLEKPLSIVRITKYIAELTLANRMVMARVKCAVNITRKYFVASFRIVPSKPGTPNRRIVHQSDRRSIAKNANKSSEKGLSVAA